MTEHDYGETQKLFYGQVMCEMVVTLVNHGCNDKNMYILLFFGTMDRGTVSNIENLHME